MNDILNDLRLLIQFNHKGKDRAVIIRDLAEQFKISEREIRDCLRILNLKGYPIMTSCHLPYGVYWANNEKEIEDYLANLKSRATSIFQRMAAIDKIKTRDFLAGQMKLFG
jgi:hypothetical protein